MMRRLVLLSTLVALFALWLILVAARADNADSQLHLEADAASSTVPLNYAPDRLLIKLGADTLPVHRTDGAWQTGQASLDRFLTESRIQAARRLLPAGESRTALEAAGLDRIYVLHLAPGSDVEGAVQALAADPSVEWAEPDYLAFPAATTPNDPLFPEQWGLARIEAPAAWDVTTGSAAVPIAIVDSGIDFSHPDLAGKVWVNPGEIAGDGLDNDNNGYIDDVNGWDFVNGDNESADDHGHGTQVAGVAGAAADDGLGVAGVCWGCRLMPVKVMQASGVANYSTIAQGVLYAAQKGARVINLSLGGYSYSSALHAAILAATGTYGAVVVGGAGNDNVSTPFYPAAHPEVLAVAGIDQADAKASFSDYGEWVDVSAPAVAITTTFSGGDWGEVNGTSFAAPFVSGLVGLIRSWQPAWSQALALAQVLHTTDPINAQNPGYEGLLGSGRINALTAVTLTPYPMLEIVATAVNGDPLGRPVPGESATLEIELANDWLDATQVAGTLTTADPYVTTSQGTASFGTIATGSSGIGSPAFAFAVAADAGYNHAIVFNLHVAANDGAYATDLPLTVTTRSADEFVGGTVGVDTIWTSDKRYIVTSNLGIAPGVTLTIQPGTEVRFDGNYSLNVGGSLIADGTAEQPIRLLHHTGGTWGRIYFDDPSVDATSTENGAYQSGNILRWISVKGASQGIGCNSATPYLSSLTLDEGGVSCFLGATTAWVQDSTVAGGLRVSGNAHVLRNAVTGGIQANEGIVQGNTVHGGEIHTGPATDIIDNHVTGGGITGDLSAGEIVQRVLNNTIDGGGISVGLVSLVSGNKVENSDGWGISCSGLITATGNRLVGNANGIYVDAGLVQGNLIANSSGVGLEISGNTSVISNTLTGNAGSAVRIMSATIFEIRGNNLEFNTGQYDVENLAASSVAAQGNWWGTTDSDVIGQRIFDSNDDYKVGTVQYSPVLAGPAQDAPAYVREVTLTPSSPVGVETVMFDVLFSRKMVQGTDLMMSFSATRKNTWQTYNTSNSGLAFNGVTAAAIDTAGNKWFGMCGGMWGDEGGVSVLIADGTWQTYNTANSGLAHNCVRAIALDTVGNKWFGTSAGASLLQPDGSWQTFSTSNSGLVDDNVLAIALDGAQNKWFGTGGHGVSVLRPDGTWQTYTSDNSGLADNTVEGIAVDALENKWFGTWGGGVSTLRADGMWQTYNSGNSGLAGNLVKPIVQDSTQNNWFGTNEGASVLLADSSWQTYNSANSGLVGDEVYAIGLEPEGNKWFGTWGGGANLLRGDGTWRTYNTANSGLADDNVTAIVFDVMGNKWFGTSGGGVSLLNGGAEDSIVDNPQWPAPALYRATYEFNALIPRDTYSLTVQGAVGSDGIEIAPNTAYTFIVDYAGAIGDTTPSPVPVVQACASSNVGTLSASWSASDPDSAITLYRYAIGSTLGGTEVINWISTTASSFEHTGLGLLAGETYYVAVAARNEGGLWSEAGIPGGLVAGSGTCTTNKRSVYLPLVLRGY